MEINAEHILDYLNQYGKGKLARERLIEALICGEKMFLIMYQGLPGESGGSEDDFDV